MDWLPDEVLLNIFGYLEQSELCTCMLVCQRWNRLSNDATFWQEIVLEFAEINRAITKTPLILSKITHQHPHIKSLVLLGDRVKNPKLSDTDLHDFLGVKTWMQFGKLSQVSLLNCPKDYLECIPNIIDACYKTLKCFQCEDTNKFQNKHFQYLFRNPLVHYTELSLAHCPTIDNLAVFESRRNPNFCECLKTLLVLNLDGTGVDDLNDDGAIGILDVCPLLLSLSLDGENLTDRTSKFIGEHFPSLQRLSFSFCSQLTDVSLECFAKLKQLQTLKLKQGENFTSEGFEHLFDSFKQHSPIDAHSPTCTMKDLSIIHCVGLKDNALTKLAETFPHLSSLDVSWCWDITDAGLEALALNCHDLTSLTLGGLGRCTGTSILEASMPRLRYLGLVQSSSIDDDKLTELKRQKPWMTIVDYYDSYVD